MYTDLAISGGTDQRPGYRALLAAVDRGECWVVVGESLDRLSRDQEHVAALLKRCRFAGVRLFTQAEGEVGELHVGLNGTMNALYLVDLADKTRRGLRGRVEAGASALLRLSRGPGQGRRGPGWPHDRRSRGRGRQAHLPRLRGRDLAEDHRGGAE